MTEAESQYAARPEPRARWSVMIPCHNDESHLEYAIRSVLAQDPGPDVMQIEVVDDASTTDPTPRIRAIAGDRVDVHRQPTRRGHVATFNTCIGRARGDYVHLLHADDAVRPGFYARLGEALGAHPEAGAAFCRYIAIDDADHWTGIAPLEQPEAGILDGWLEKLATGQRLQPPCIVVRRGVYDVVGLFDGRFPSYGEDWEMWTRIAASYPVWYEPEPLALYRVAPNSLSSSALRTGDNVRQLLEVIEVNRSRLPADRVEEVTRAARRDTAQTAIRRGVRLARRGDTSGARAQLQWSRRADRSVKNLLLTAAGSALVAAESIRQRRLRRAHARP